MNLFYFGISFLMKTSLLTLSTWRVKGQELVPPGPLVIASNHTSYLDAPLLSASIPRRIVWMAKQEVFDNPISGPMARSFGAFPIKRGVGDLKAFRTAFYILEKGLALGMFPEGSRDRTRKMRRAYPGTAFVAAKSGVPVLPVGIAGAERVQTRLDIFSQPTIEVNIGPPFVLPQLNGAYTRSDLVVLSDLLMTKIASLLPQHYRGTYNVPVVDTNPIVELRVG